MCLTVRAGCYQGSQLGKVRPTVSLQVLGLHYCMVAGFQEQESIEDKVEATYYDLDLEVIKPLRKGNTDPTSEWERVSVTL